MSIKKKPSERIKELGRYTFLKGSSEVEGFNFEEAILTFLDEREADVGGLSICETIGITPRSSHTIHKVRCACKDLRNCEECEKERAQGKENWIFTTGGCPGHTPTEGWEKGAAKIAVDAYKECGHYAKFSPIIHDGIRAILSQHQQSFAEKIKALKKDVGDNENANHIFEWKHLYERRYNQAIDDALSALTHSKE